MKNSVELKDSPDHNKIKNACEQLISTYTDFKLAHPDRLEGRSKPLAYIIASKRKVRQIRQHVIDYSIRTLTDAGFRCMRDNKCIVS